MRVDLAAALLSIGLGASSCFPQLQSLIAPATVQAGQEFPIEIIGRDDFSSIASTVGCVLQLPTSVAVTRFSVSAPVNVSRDVPASLALYTAEPGHYLTSFETLLQVGPSVSLTVWVRAPTAGSTLQVKTSLYTDHGGTLRANSPPGMTLFATIGGAHARLVSVVSDAPRFAEAGLAFTPGSTTWPSSLTTADVDADGRDEILDCDGYRLIVHDRRPASGWTQTTSSLPQSVYRGNAVAAGNFDADGNTDIVIADGTVLFGDGAGGWPRTASLSPFPGTVVMVAVGDVDADGFDDIAALEPVTGEPRVFRSDGVGAFTSFGSGLGVPIERAASGPWLADVSGDGLPDLVFWSFSSAGHVARTFVGDGRGNWTANHSPVVAGRWFPGHGQIDGAPGDELIYQGNLGSDLHVLSLAGGAWVDRAATLGLPLLSTESVADHTGDGFADCLVRLPDRTHALAINDGTGNFTVDLYSGVWRALATGAVTTGDFDGDGWLDLAGLDELQRGLMVWTNESLGAARFGRGCGAQPATPELRASGTAQLGNAAFALVHTGGPANAIGAIWLGYSSGPSGLSSLPLQLDPLGAPGCQLLAAPVVATFVVHDATGRATLPLPLPPNPLLHRFEVFAQGAVVAPGANSLGVAFSGGVGLRLD